MARSLLQRLHNRVVGNVGVIRSAGADERRQVGRSDGGFLDAILGCITRVRAQRTGNRPTTRRGRSAFRNRIRIQDRGLGSDTSGHPSGYGTAGQSTGYDRSRLLATSEIAFDEIAPWARSQLVVEILTACYDETKAGNIAGLTAPASSPASVTTGARPRSTTPWAAS